MSYWNRLDRMACSAAVIVTAMALWGCEESRTLTEPVEQAEGSTGAVPNAVANQELAQVRRATAGYNDVRKAVADGYQQFSIHVPGMGIHYLTSAAIGTNGNSTLDNSLDRTDPEILVYVGDAPRSQQRRLVAAEYAVPKDGSSSPPSHAVSVFSGADASDWHVHPSVHELPLPSTWTIHGECHYVGGLGVFLAENPAGDFVLWTPPTGALGSWSGTVAADQCPTSLGGNPLPPLLIAHGKWWTLHAWVWYPNPEGVFHPTNPRVSG